MKHPRLIVWVQFCTITAFVLFVFADFKVNGILPVIAGLVAGHAWAMALISGFREWGGR